jgi:hypothetical protein
MKFRFTHVLDARHALAAAALSLLLAGSVHAGLTLQMNLIHNSGGGEVYTFAPNLYLNGNGGDSTPITYDQIYSPHTNFTGGVGTGSLNNRDTYPDFKSLMQVVTNGVWQLILNVGDPSQHVYTFTIKSTLANNPYVDAVVDYPPDGANGLVPLPTFSWHGPINTTFLEAYVYGGPSNVFQYVLPSMLSTSATLPPALAEGYYNFNIYYEANVSGWITASVPKDGSGNAPPNLNSLALFDSGSGAAFSVGIAAPISTNVSSGHTNMAHYTFDDSGNLDADSSGNGNDLNDVWWGPRHSFSTNAETGGGAVQFVGTSDMYTPDYNPSLSSWTNTLAGSFSVSVWINTTNTVGDDDGDLGDLSCDSRQDVIQADTGGPGVIPVALTGSKVAFLTLDADGNADTLHSQQSVTTGQYVHIVSTRDQTTGEKRIYINGQLDSSTNASTELLAGETSCNIGGEWGCAGYIGLVDDAQIYSGVLKAADVSNLFANPGTTISNVAGSSYSSDALGAALNSTNLAWTVLGDAPWFVESTNSNDGVSAAQSGSLLDSQSSILQTTVIGPGILTFYWECMANDDSFNLEFDIDGNDYDAISWNNSWTQEPEVSIPSGIHVLSWNANTFNDTGSSPADAGWVDQVVFTPTYAAPSAASLENQARVGTNFQFSFYAQLNHTNFVQYTTNLANPSWVPYSTIIGDGTVKTIDVPINSPKQLFFRVGTQ